MKRTHEIRMAMTGDSFITQRLPRDDASLQAIRKLLMDADVRFTNLETTVHNFDAYPSAASGGTWAASRPSVLKDLRWLNFNLLACANNHSLDWSHNGLLQTIHYLSQEDWTFAGIGSNLAEAGRPCYLDTKNGRVALISVTATFENWHRAGEQRPDVIGRPGINPLGHHAIHYVPDRWMQVLKQIDQQTDIDAKANLDIIEGFKSGNGGSFCVGGAEFRLGKPGTSTLMDRGDAERIGRSIREASRQADVVLISIHSHEMRGMDKEQPAEFIRQFARFCIDQGAQALIGHGPHVLRGIELYKGCPIFYSLGDFIFQNDTVERQPAEFYDLYHLDSDSTPADGFDARSDHGNRGLAANPKVFESVIGSMILQNGRVEEIRLTPITMGFDKPRSGKGRPSLASSSDGTRIIGRLKKLSEPFGTKISIREGIGCISIRENQRVSELSEDGDRNGEDQSMETDF